MPREVACKKCKAVTIGKVCPICKATDLTLDWSGIIIIFDASKSGIAATLDISIPHKYAHKVS